MSSKFISTASGLAFHFERPTVDMIDIRDIAAALGKLCRFTGQCSRFYSVAEHSVHVSYLVPPELALYGLLHDATEAYCADIAKPLKELLPDYQAVEKRVWLVVAAAFNLPAIMPPAIKQADMAMLKLEANHLLPACAVKQLALPGAPADRGLSFWDHDRASFYFMTRYYDLTKGLPFFADRPKIAG